MYNLVQGTELKAEKNVKDVGLDPMMDIPETSATWHIEFRIRQKAILELWQSCNVSLVHRTYFFLLFRGDPTDSIYMEVEMRRLSFLKEAFLLGNHAVEGGQTLTLASRSALCLSYRLMLLKSYDFIASVSILRLLCEVRKRVMSNEYAQWWTHGFY